MKVCSEASYDVLPDVNTHIDVVIEIIEGKNGNKTIHALMWWGHRCMDGPVSRPGADEPTTPPW
jgi:hypothetical protein